MWVLLREGVAEREEQSARASVHVVRARARARVCVYGPTLLRECGHILRCGGMCEPNNS